VSKRPFRIGIVLSDFPAGGTERIALRLAAAWIDAGVEVDIFCGNEGGAQRHLVPDGARLVAASPPIRRGWGARRKLGKAARDHFAAHPVDALFIPGNYHWATVPPLMTLKREGAVRLICQASSALEKLQRRGVRQRWFERRMRRQLAGVDVVVTLADEMSAIARRILGRADIVTLPLPALPDTPRPPTAVPSATTIVLAIGRLVSQKDFRTLIDAFALVEHRGARLEIVGSGPDERMLRRRIAAAGLGDRVKLVGFAEDVRPWLDRARLFVLSSGHEGYGAVIIEALAAGRPVVSTDCTPAARELLHDGVAGRVVPVGDPPALAAAIDAMLAEPVPDPAALAKLVDRFRIGRVAAAYLELAGFEVVKPGSSALRRP
jgi:glycosyltransferase involved in cell wall biosynthesis